MPPTPLVAPPPPAASGVFGAGLSSACRYAELLASAGVTRGLIGPRETPRLWERHLLNSAVLAELLPPNARIVDVGSGAGLPGIALACARRDLQVDLVDTLRRRTAFLVEAVAELGLTERVRVVTGRAEEAAVRNQVGRSQFVSARAVAPLDRLARWCLPLLSPGGLLLAIKGGRSTDEISEHRAAVGRLGGEIEGVRVCGEDVLVEPTRVVLVRRR